MIKTLTEVVKDNSLIETIKQNPVTTGIIVMIAILTLSVIYLAFRKRNK